MNPSLSESLRRVNALIAGQGPSNPDRASLDAIPVEILRQTAANRSAPSSDRRAALSALSERLRGESGFSEIVLLLVDAPNDPLPREAILAAPPFDVRVIERLRLLLDDPRPAVWE